MTTDSDSRGDIGSYPGVPRWVKVFGLIAILVLLLVVLRLTGVVTHEGPGRHFGSGHAGQTAPPPTAEDHTPPGGADRHAPPERGH